MLIDAAQVWRVDQSAPTFVDQTAEFASVGLKIFAAVSTDGASNRIMTSADGITWASRTSAADNQWFGVTWSPELALFVAVGVTGTSNRVMTSADGVTWTSRTSAADNQWFAVTWSPELAIFVAVAGSGTGNRVMTSADGITWTIRTSAANVPWGAVTWSPELSLFVAVAQTVGAGDRIMTSADGITWVLRTSPTPTQWNDVTWSPKLAIFVAVAGSGTGNRVMTSADGITWTTRASADDLQWTSIAWAPQLSLLVAVAASGGPGTTRVMTSPNGVDWTSGTTPNNQWFAVAWAPELGLFAAVANLGTGNRIMTSADGLAWATRTSAADNDWRSVTWASPGDVHPFPFQEAISDYMAIGLEDPFIEVLIAVSTAGIGGVVAWEYWDGSAWETLSVTDNTNGFTVFGQNSVTFDAPADWGKRTLNGSASLFYARARVTTLYTANPIISRGLVNKLVVAAITGRETIVAMKSASTWKTPVSFVAGDGMLIRSWGMVGTRQRNKDMSLGLPFVTKQDKGREFASGTQSAYLRYQGLETVFSHAMGNDTLSAELTSGEGDYRHELAVTTRIVGKMVTLAAKMKSESVHQIDTAKITGFTIAIEGGMPAIIQYSILGSRMIRGGASLVAAATVTERSNRVIADDACEILINDQSSIALAGADTIIPTKIVFAFQRKMGRQWTKGMLQIDEPDDDDYPENTLALTFPKYIESERYDDWVSDVAKKAVIKFTGAQINAGVNRAFEIWMPHLRAREADPVLDGPGKIPQPVVFDVLAADSAPPGFTTSDFSPVLAENITNPFVILINNALATEA